jgi:hypothetical protein
MDGQSKLFKENLFKFKGNVQFKTPEQTHEKEIKKLISNIELNSELENAQSKQSQTISGTDIQASTGQHQISPKKRQAEFSWSQPNWRQRT